jgi:hypothetical protein
VAPGRLDRLVAVGVAWRVARLERLRAPAAAAGPAAATARRRARHVEHGPAAAADGQQVAALWLRRLRATGDVLFSGLYSVVELQAPVRPAVRVVFPLPNGRLVVVLEVRNRADGGLVLSSGAAAWGQPGAYLVVEDGRGCWARRVPLHEVFEVHVDGEGVLRTDHRLSLAAAPVLRLHYRMTRELR